ncbi:lipoyl domain-containing protein [Phenylobacterium immobile]|uniref:lipoyl domain-containing protein n=1 Tax=Phenylobacterium immobile TaxID=21 RepID=UPI000B81B221|nr:lipoyl domain-containing protein [Phenylobacterium immobile]
MNVTLSEDLWSSRVFPEGVLEAWRVEDGDAVMLGDAIAEVRIEDQLHEVTAPGGGVLHHMSVIGDVIEPGSVIAVLR